MLMEMKADRMQHVDKKHTVRTYFYDSTELKRSIKFFEIRNLMFPD